MPLFEECKAVIQGRQFKRAITLLKEGLPREALSVCEVFMDSYPDSSMAADFAKVRNKCRVLMARVEDEGKLPAEAWSLHQLMCKKGNNLSLKQLTK